jgi:hypothetical protein
LVAIALAAACSGGSGVDGKLAINSLQPADWTRYCNWYNGEVSTTVGKSCADGSLVPNIQISDCTAKSPAGTCPATVSQVEDCVHKYKDHICDGITKVAPTCNNFPPNCFALFAGSNAVN